MTRFFLSITQGIRRGLLKSIKIPIYRAWFRLVLSRRMYALVRGKLLVAFRDVFGSEVKYPWSICNAGLIALGSGGFLTVFKSQTYTVDPTSRIRKALPPDSGRKQLYIAEFDRVWALKRCGELKASMGGRILRDDEGLEDARLFSVRGETWLCANYDGHRRTAWPCLGKLEGDRVEFRQPAFDAVAPQKNWMPFVWNDDIYLEYLVNPRRILKYDVVSGMLSDPGWPGQEWFPWSIHGGAPPLQISDDVYLGLGNTQQRFWYQERYYSAVLYLFEAKPPFHVMKATPPLRFNSRRHRVQYVTGMVMLSDADELIVSFGINDYDNHVIPMNLRRLIALMKDV